LRHLFLPDIHNQIKIADQIVALAPPHDRVVQLGDVFDSFHDTDDIIRETAVWLKDKLANQNWTVLFGNHDMPYAFPYIRDFKCPGWEEFKHYAVRQVLKDDDFGKMKFTHRIGNVVLSHAGISQGLMRYLYEIGKFHDENISENFGPIVDKLCSEALGNILCGHPHELLAWGYSRGGGDHPSGITWADYSEFVPIAGYHQIFGHTPLPSANFAISTLKAHGYWNPASRIPQYALDDAASHGSGWCIDTHLHTFCIFDDVSKMLSIYSVQTERVEDWKDPKYLSRKVFGYDQILSIKLF
jgi:hypothetical protein